jgi:mycofactocin glycosyltransferase
MTRVAGERAAAGEAPPRSRLDPRIGPMNLRSPPPAELAVALHPKVRVLDRGRVLVGGTPLRVLRLTAEGARAIAEWGAPSPVGDLPARRALARRLLDAGVLSPYPARAAPTSALTVVVPTRDRPAHLARCLEAVRASCPQSPIVVVDDGSRDPAAVHAACAEHGVAVIRHDVSGGAAAARNSGLAASPTAYVAFVDSDVVVPRSWAAALIGHFADPCVGAVAPRVQALPPHRGLIGGYEQRHSALDMGPDGGLVAPGLPTPYMPSTVVVVRRSAIGTGFDESLHIGEDVDLVWRLSLAGWLVRYEPTAHVWHDHRVELRAFIARRRLYARSVGMLARRHPDALPATKVNPRLALVWALALAGHRRAALGAAIVEALLIRGVVQRLTGRTNGVAGILVARGLLATGLGLAHAARRAWAPPLCVLAFTRPNVRRVMVTAFAARITQDAITTRAYTAVLGDAAVRLLDEAVASAGTWEGCLQERTIRPLLPSWGRAGSARVDHRRPAPSLVVELGPAHAC